MTTTWTESVSLEVSNINLGSLHIMSRIYTPQERYKMMDSICERCGVSVRRKGPRRFCSRSCYHIFSRGENSPHWKPNHWKVCIMCGSKFRQHREDYSTRCNTTKNRGKKTCSPTCRQKLKWRTSGFMRSGRRLVLNVATK